MATAVNITLVIIIGLSINEKLRSAVVENSHVAGSQTERRDLAFTGSSKRLARSLSRHRDRLPVRCQIASDLWGN